MNEFEFIHRIKYMIQSNQPYYTIFDLLIEFMLDHRISMKPYELHRNVRIYIQPYASPELMNYLKKNIEFL